MAERRPFPLSFLSMIPPLDLKPSRKEWCITGDGGGSRASFSKKILDIPNTLREFRFGSSLEFNNYSAKKKIKAIKKKRLPSNKQ